MVTMAERKKPAKSGKGRGRPVKHAVEPDAQGRTGTPISLRIDPDIRANINPFIAEYRRRSDVKLSMTDVVELALTRLFREYGIVPPANPPPGPPPATS